MNFKEWLILSEAIDATTKNLLAKAKAPQDQLDAFIKELEDEPTLIDKPTAFQKFQDKFNIQKKEKPKDEDAQRKHFATIPNTTEEELQTYDYYKNENKDSLKKMMEQLRKFIDKKLITIKIENNIPVIYRNTTQGSQKLDTPDFGRFTSQLDSIQGSLEQYKGKNNYFNPIEEELNHQQNLVAKGDNIWVFKGHAPDVCRIYGKGHPWCISSSTSAAHWFTYRIEHHQTQYFVFDFNKDEDDPARYVNPGVSPEGMYSEWVDATNQHSKDPEDSESDVGINGYNSINEYKKYLVSKGIPLTTWTTIPPEKWEKSLHRYYNKKDFVKAKNDSDPRVFPMYLKIVDEIKDADFETLTDEQKREFILGKIDDVTEKQFAYAIENFKGEYYNSLDLKGKIQFAGKTNDQEKLLKLAENPKLSDENVNYLYTYIDIEYHEKVAELIINNKPEISRNDLSNFLVFANDKAKVAKLIIQKKPDLTDYDIDTMIHHATEKDKMAEIIIENKPELTDDNVKYLLLYATDKEVDKIAELIIKHKTKLSDDNVKNLLQHATEKDEIAKLIIEKKPELSGGDVYYLIDYATNIEKIKELLQRKTDNVSKLSNQSIVSLLLHGGDIDKIVELLTTDNINKLSWENVWKLMYLARDKPKMAQILKHYHTKKTPEIQELIDKYLHEL